MLYSAALRLEYYFIDQGYSHEISIIYAHEHPLIFKVCQKIIKVIKLFLFRRGEYWAS